LKEYDLGSTKDMKQYMGFIFSLYLNIFIDASQNVYKEIRKEINRRETKADKTEAATEDQVKNEIYEIDVSV
jgi:hypothetical protein